MARLVDGQITRSAGSAHSGQRSRPRTDRTRERVDDGVESIGNVVAERDRPRGVGRVVHTWGSGADHIMVGVYLVATWQVRGDTETNTSEARNWFTVAMTQLRDIEDAMRRAESPVLSAPQIAERIGKSSEWVRQHLMLLEREGAVGRQDVGARATAWWHRDRVCDPIVPPAEHPDQSGLQEAVEQRGDQEDSDDRDGRRDVVAAQTPESAARAVEVPGQGAKAERRREAVERVLAALRDRGPLDADELRSIGFEDGVGYADRQSMWKNCLSPALGELRDREIVALVDRARGRWGWDA